MPVGQVSPAGSRCRGGKGKELYWRQCLCKIKGQGEQELERRPSDHCRFDICEKTGGRKAEERVSDCRTPLRKFQCTQRISNTKITWEESALHRNSPAQCWHHAQIYSKDFWSCVPRFLKLGVTNFRAVWHKLCTTIIMISCVLFKHIFNLEILVTKVIFSICSISG